MALYDRLVGLVALPSVQVFSELHEDDVVVFHRRECYFQVDLGCARLIFGIKC